MRKVSAKGYVYDVNGYRGKSNGATDATLEKREVKRLWCNIGEK